jgi:hypothetical protein
MSAPLPNGRIRFLKGDRLARFLMFDRPGWFRPYPGYPSNIPAILIQIFSRQPLEFQPHPCLTPLSAPPRFAIT